MPYPGNATFAYFMSHYLRY